MEILTGNKLTTKVGPISGTPKHAYMDGFQDGDIVKTYMVLNDDRTPLFKVEINYWCNQIDNYGFFTVDFTTPQNIKIESKSLDKHRGKLLNIYDFSIDGVVSIVSKILNENKIQNVHIDQASQGVMDVCRHHQSTLIECLSIVFGGKWRVSESDPNYVELFMPIGYNKYFEAKRENP